MNAPGGGETKTSVSAWTTDSLHSHIITMVTEMDRRYDQRFQAQEKAVVAALASAALAVDKAENNAERWRANANEWRGAMNDRDRLLMPRIESERMFSILEKKIDSVTRVCVAALFLGIAIITVVLLIWRK